MGDIDPDDLHLEISSAKNSFSNEVPNSLLDMLNYIYRKKLLDLYSNLSSEDTSNCTSHSGDRKEKLLSFKID